MPSLSVSPWSLAAGYEPALFTLLEDQNPAAGSSAAQGPAFPFRSGPRSWEKSVLLCGPYTHLLFRAFGKRVSSTYCSQVGWGHTALERISVTRSILHLCWVHFSASSLHGPELPRQEHDHQMLCLAHSRCSVGTQRAGDTG